jgi:hypothetical protein
MNKPSPDPIRRGLFSVSGPDTWRLSLVSIVFCLIGLAICVLGAISGGTLGWVTLGIGVGILVVLLIVALIDKADWRHRELLRAIRESKP